ncbi:hypothetical protein BDN70DRAFT_932201 [Pholiota conissans]|uniref:Uncharacterized protein n=1 Tax=Pholiota conissans TaxID=109636 RepID=A0A9P5Z4N2_9AGAR|nr:hypothetical protein BDN70DRAFT_932201 [Pholiota conissans]
MSLSVIEDIESGKEFERIKQNFTPTPPDPDVLANLAEIQTAFEDLQSELHDFLAKYTDKLMGLQTRITTTSLPSTTSHESDTHKTVVPTAMTARMSRHSTVEAQHTIEDSLSDRMLSVKPTLKVENIPLDTHLRHLQTFLNAQMDNIRRLHDASHSPTTQMTHKEEKPMPSGESTRSYVWTRWY